ncbi:MAG: VCBS repeat-containing protein [Planctomycetota bacterium]
MLAALLLCAVQIPAPADPAVKGAPAHDGAPLRYEARALCVSPNETCAVGDVDHDGHVDLVAGPNWYRGPEMVARPLRDVPEALGGAYLANNGEHLIDVDGDGWLDVVAGSFFDEDLCWYRNPGAEGLRRGIKWVRTVLAKVGTSNEMTMAHDLDGDGHEEILVNSWNDLAAVVAWRFVREDGKPPRIEPFTLGARQHGHGLGVGDLDGDGHVDLITKTAWYAQPAGGAFGEAWTMHKDGDLGRASCPILVFDVDGDGRNDAIEGQGHGYGVDWLHQLAPNADGSLHFERKPIDASFSQAHALLLVDLLGEGRPGFVTGKRVRAHEQGDPGGDEAPVMWFFRYDQKEQRFERHLIQEGVGTGLQIRAADFDGDGKLDLACSGKSGTWVLLRRD